MSAVYHWLVRGDGYQITSGPIIVLSAWAYGIAWLHHHNCHVKRCWRLSWHPHPGHGHPVCRRHHPDHPRRDHMGFSRKKDRLLSDVLAETKATRHDTRTHHRALHERHDAHAEQLERLGRSVAELHEKLDAQAKPTPVAVIETKATPKRAAAKPARTRKPSAKPAADKPKS